MQEFRTVFAWQKSHALTLNVYALTQSFPAHESLGLVTQLRRTAVTTPQRIAEACGRDLPTDKLRALGQARAALVELEYLLLLSHDLHLIEDLTQEALQAQLIDARKILSGFIKAIGNTAVPQPLLS